MDAICGIGRLMMGPAPRPTVHTYRHNITDCRFRVPGERELVMQIVGGISGSWEKGSYRRKYCTLARMAPAHPLKYG